MDDRSRAHAGMVEPKTSQFILYRLVVVVVVIIPEQNRQLACKPSTCWRSIWMKTEMPETQSDQKKKSNPNQVKCFGPPLPAVRQSTARPASAGSLCRPMPPRRAVPSVPCEFPRTKLDEATQNFLRRLRDVKFEEMKGAGGGWMRRDCASCVARTTPFIYACVQSANGGRVASSAVTRLS